MVSSQIEAPQRIKDNCRQVRGYYVPYVIYKDDFRINDSEKLAECIQGNKCHICGTVIDHNKMWYVAGPGSLFHPFGAVIDGAMHYECATYALKVCPYLAYNVYKKKLDIDKLQAKHEDLILVDPTVELDRVPLFGLVRAYNFGVMSTGNIRLSRPYERVEFWNNGVRLPSKEGLVIVREYLKEKYNVDPVY